MKEKDGMDDSNTNNVNTKMDNINMREKIEIHKKKDKVII